MIYFKKSPIYVKAGTLVITYKDKKVYDLKGDGILLEDVGVTYRKAGTVIYGEDFIEVVIYDEPSNGESTYSETNVDLTLKYKSSKIKIYENVLTVLFSAKEPFSRGLSENVAAHRLLDDVFKYILPTGYSVRYRKYTPLEETPDTYYIDDDSGSYIRHVDIDQSHEPGVPETAYPINLTSVVRDSLINHMNQNKLLSCVSDSVRGCLHKHYSEDGTYIKYNDSLAISSPVTQEDLFPLIKDGKPVTLLDICDFGRLSKDCKIAFHANVTLNNPVVEGNNKTVIRFGDEDVKVTGGTNSISLNSKEISFFEDRPISVIGGAEIYDISVTLYETDNSSYVSTLEEFIGANVDTSATYKIQKPIVDTKTTL